MSWSRALRRTLIAAALAGAAGVMAGCSFSPVYSGTLAQQPAIGLAYAKPTNRLEQVIYHELGLRLGESTAQTAPLATVTASSSAIDVISTVNRGVATPVEVTVTATLTITRPDDEADVTPRSFTRSASAGYTRSGQVLADNAAADEASERAARSAAESLRLAILAALSR